MQEFLQTVFFSVGTLIAFLYLASRWMRAKDREVQPLMDQMYKMERKIDDLKTSVACLENTMERTASELKRALDR